LSFKVRPKEKGKPVFEDHNMVNISFFSTTGCSITVYCTFAQDPVEIRLMMIDRRNNMKAEEEERMRNPDAERKRIIAYLEKVSEDMRKNRPKVE
jgi:hypothetical protein